MDHKTESEMIQMLVEDNRRLKAAGCKLAEAALYVAREYDGLHRLMLAVSEWSKVMADEGGRDRRHSEDAHSQSVRENRDVDNL